LPQEQVRPQASFVEDLGADSLAIAQLTLAFEEAFDIDISEKAVEHLRTVQDAIDCIERQMHPGVPAP
jgi:acyl carrier protein